MSSNRLSRCFISLFFTLVLCASLFTATPTSGSAAGRAGVADWCGDPAASDWVCPEKGAVYSDSRLLGKRGVSPVAPQTSVTTAARSRARLTFKNQARCTLGGVPLSRIFVRWDSSHSLFTQEQGYSSCTSLKAGVPVNILCSPAEPCPTELRARGTYLIKILPPDATASATEVVHRRARIVVCTGSLRIRTATGTGYSEASGSASELTRWIVIVEQTISTTTDEIVTETATENTTEKTTETRTGGGESTNFNIIGNQPGPGDCADPAVQEQEETVERY